MSVKIKIDKRYMGFIITSLVLLNIGMLFGQKITGRLAYSNVFQVVSFVFILPVIFKTFNIKNYMFIILNFFMIFVAGIFVANIYNFTPKFEHFVFFFMTLSYIILFWLVSKKYNLEPTINKIYRSLAIPLLAYFILFAVYELMAKGGTFVNLGFDDKSHTTIICAFFAFVTLALIKHPAKYIASLLFMVLSLLTISRLSIIFLGFYSVCFFYSYIKDSKVLLRKRERSTPLKLYFYFVFFILTLSLGIWFFVKNYQQFPVFNRVSSMGAIQDSGSTQGHLLLIKYGLVLKFQSFMNFIFGIGPGSYSLAAVNSGIDLSGFAFVDPVGYRAMLRGVMPMHSAHFSFLVEFPIIFFFAYVVLLCKIFISLVRKRLFIDCMFFISFVAATTFYSSHNELFFYSILVYFISRSFYKKKRL